ncbi:N-alpha-acetyltransferase 25, NatB auxiliary subunit [Cichlidogyrus casuarinus]|uniref:N-alpha-acetyltransferase 25, NatB auxiliary subunit n=1 Tax=Cichlidogyrus casuarinus TaxID=1844966 RepID=A0ABD2QD49_9PLAT
MDKLLKQFPTSEHFILIKFFHNLRLKEFSSLQPLARKLVQTETQNKQVFQYWPILVSILFAHADPKMALKLHLPLASKQLIRQAENSQILNHDEFSLLLSVFVRLGDYESVLNYLNSSLLSKLQEADKKNYDSQKLQCYYHLDKWSEAFLLCKNLLQATPDEWTVFKTLLRMVFKKTNGQLSISLDRFNEFQTFLVNLKETSNSRGLMLTLLDIHANLEMVDSPVTVQFPPALPLLTEYLRSFLKFPVCSQDIAFLIPFLHQKPESIRNILSSNLTDARAAYNPVGVLA